ncbi:probable serine/threonine-protein kinase irlD [Mytilus trossulus]|uniref:probable serine/threonine-protein kinase irlD n=1 Tax=Mytilus trossulus TaxID=6551 RepID=UPI003007DACA
MGLLATWSMSDSNWIPVCKGTFEDCAQIRVNDGYTWYDFPCSGGPAYHYSSICEYKMPKMLTSSTTGTNVETPVPTTMAKTQTSTATTLAKIDTPAPTVLPNVETPAPTVFPNVETPAMTVLPNVETPASTTLLNVETPAPYKDTSEFTTRIITNPPSAGIVNKETVITGWGKRYEFSDLKCNYCLDYLCIIYIM